MEKEKRISSIDKFFLAFIIIFLLFLVWYYEQVRILNWMKQYYPIWLIYNHIYTQVAQRTLLGLLYASVFGSLFFIFLPIEALFIYYNELPYSKADIFAITVFGNLVGQAANYGIGRLFGPRLVKKILKDDFDKFANIVMKYGSSIILIGNFLIFPIEPVSVVIGAGKYPFKRFMVLSFIGKMFKFALMLVASQWISAHLMSYL
jgi:membrane protein YqaA with SNARE-associated domain